MTNHDQAKSMARSIRAALARDKIDISHSRALELAAAALGYADWNTASALLESPPDSSGKSNATDCIRFENCSPVLRIFDEAKAREFYIGFLGFQEVFQHRFEPGLPLYLGIARTGLQLHLSEHHGDASPGSTVFVPMTGIQAYHQELLDRHYSYGRPGLQKQEWGTQLEVHDPFGNRIRFCEKAG
ncbi:glyoxalase superfamily protein [Kiloniella laminariae]|uniref:Bleomycin resistance protein n=1 Tax=Kiloniella laminariae TaxID=454162 RepID=A0ABT4LL97_9PROT|nr:glyoxalase superfamily protein [Kiloniella laminariae]MCZ4280737.1 glyoxalase superfamily protein [Kiloniella laminariae]